LGGCGDACDFADISVEHAHQSAGEFDLRRRNWLEMRKWIEMREWIDMRTQRR
jgi:hypothetical protein